MVVGAHIAPGPAATYRSAVADLRELLPDLDETVRSAVEKSGVPAASVAVLVDDDVVSSAAGVLNVRTGVEATVDSLFQIGSITKVYTATLVMQLVDSGQVELDAPVRTYLPSFRVSDPVATEAITVRHLLTHTSGFDGGDYFVDTGSGEDNLERYVESLAGLEQLAPPGTVWSYNNAGFGTLGRLIEVMTGQVWDDAIRERLLRPAGLESSVTTAEEALLFRTAAGHQPGPDGKPALVSRWGMHRNSGPAGGVCASATDLVGFAQLHIDDGRGPEGNQVLSPGSVKAMQQRQVDLLTDPAGGFGLGWLLRDLDGERTIGHNGGTLGQAAFLTVLPDRRFALGALTNGPGGAAVWEAVASHVFDRVLGLPHPKPRLPELPTEPPDVDLSKYEGRYERRSLHATVKAGDDGLVLEHEMVDFPYELPKTPPMTIRPIDAETFAIVGPDGEPASTLKFLDFDADGRPQLLFNARLARRR